MEWQTIHLFGLSPVFQATLVLVCIFEFSHEHGFSNLTNLGTGVWGERSSSPGVCHLYRVILPIVPAQGGPFIEAGCMNATRWSVIWGNVVTVRANPPHHKRQVSCAPRPSGGKGKSLPQTHSA